MADSATTSNDVVYARLSPTGKEETDYLAGEGRGIDNILKLFTESSKSMSLELHTEIGVVHLEKVIMADIDRVIVRVTIPSANDPR